MAAVLTINGTPVNRPGARLILNRLSLSLDAPDTLEFTEIRATLPGSFGKGRRVTLAQDDQPVFNGQIVGAYFRGIGRRQIDVGYRALGLSWLANQVFITAPDGTGRLVYNMPRTDDGNYIASNAGLAVGEILKRLFNLHWPQLTAAGITAFSEPELDLLDVVPPEPVVLAGRLWNAASELLYTWCNKYQMRIDGRGVIRIENALALPRYRITLDSEPAIVDGLSRDHSECYTRCVVRGGPDTQGAYLTLQEETIAARWSAAQQAAWRLDDFYAPRGSSDVGGIVAQTSTSLTLQSDDASLAWAVNALSGINAEIIAYNPAAEGISFSESRRVTANTALTPGGTYEITVDTPWENTGYSRYSIRGLSSAVSLVGRAFDVVPDYVANHLVTRLSHSVPWAPSDGIVTQTTHPQAVVCKNGVEVPVTFQIVPPDGVDRGYIVFDEPVFKVFGPRDELIVGNLTNAIPDDIKMLVPYSRGALQSSAPDVGNEGTAYTVDEVDRPLYRDYPDWLDYRDASNFGKLAREVLDTVKDTVVEMTITYLDLYRNWGLGIAIDLAQAENLTGFEDINAPVRTVTIDYQDQAAIYTTTMQCSNRLRPFAGDRLYVHPGFGGGGYQFMGLGIMPNVGDWSYAASHPEELLMGDQGEAFIPEIGDPNAVNTYRPRRKTVGPSAEQTERDPMGLDRWYEKEQSAAIDRDQAENARRARESERREIRQRNEEKAENRRKFQVPDDVLDEHLRNID